jgi:SH3-like domain-containing protein
MKRQLKVLVVLTSLCIFVAAPAFAAQFLSVITDNANVRTGPGTKYPVTMELFDGYPLKVLKIEGEWYKVEDFEKDTGWIHQSIVKENDTVIVNARKSLNMRAKPSTKAQIVADVERGAVLTRLSSENKWTEVRASTGKTGWIYSPLLWP